MTAAPTHTHPGLVAAWLGDTPISATEVDVLLARLRAGRRAALLPVADSPEGRQLRRWATQVVITRRLLEDVVAELDAATLDAATNVPRAAEIVANRQDALELGTVLANVLTQSASARVVFAAVTQSVRASSSDVAAYYSRNSDEFVDPAAVRLPLDAVAELIGERLTSSQRRSRFVNWVDERRARLVRLEPGYEHPADPRQPDATHRH